MVNESSNVGKIDVGLMFMVESVIVVLGEVIALRVFF